MRQLVNKNASIFAKLEYAHYIRIMILRKVIDLRANKTKFGKQEALFTNIKKAYSFYFDLVKEMKQEATYTVTPLSYATVADELKRKGQFYHGDAGILIIKRMVL